MAEFILIAIVTVWTVICGLLVTVAMSDRTKKEKISYIGLSIVVFTIPAVLVVESHLDDDRKPCIEYKEEVKYDLVTKQPQKVTMCAQYAGE